MIDRSGYVGGGSEMCCEWRHGLAKDEMGLGEACVSWSLGLRPWLRERERDLAGKVEEWNGSQYSFVLSAGKERGGKSGCNFFGGK